MARIPVGVDIDGEGAHPAAWRAADHPPAELLAPGRIAERFRAIDESGLGFVTLPEPVAAEDSPNVRAGLDTIETANFAAAVTSRVGLVAEAAAIHAEPYHLANQLNTLDWSAAGRGGWLVRVDDSARVAAGYGREPHADPAAAVREARDVVRAVRTLWDTWEDSVFIADEQTHRFLDLDRWHYADVEGESFRIKGPGLLPRPPQGQLVVWAEEPDAGLAPLVDVAVVSAASVEGTAARARELGELGIPRRVAAVEIALDALDVRGADRLAALDRSTPWPGRDRLRLTGSAAEVADVLAGLAAQVAGIRLHPAVLDVDLPLIAEGLLPALDAAGVLRAPAAGETLRELFALERPVNAFELARENR